MTEPRKRVRGVLYPFGLILACLIGFLQPLRAQIVVDSGITFPLTPAQDTWHLDPVLDQLWVWKDEWKFISANVKKIVPCNNFLAVYSSLNFQIFQSDGVVMFDKPQEYYCADSVLVVYSRVDDGKSAMLRTVRVIYFLGRQGQLLWRSGGLLSHATEVHLGGALGWCIPLFSENATESVAEYERHYWGVFGSNGKWLVPPIYDDHFQFVNGVADVKLYGKSLKINEKGEELP